jgi:hypothetical protein
VRAPSRQVGLVVVALLVATACSGTVSVGGTDPSPTSPPSPQEPTAPVPTAPRTPEPSGRPDPDPGIEIAEGDRLAVQGADHQLFTVLADGSNRIALTDSGEGTVNLQAAWSPDANRIGWVAVDPSTGVAEVRAARFDGSQWSQAGVPSPPVALAWDATGTQIASLAPIENGLELGVVSLGEATGYTPIDRGAPLFFSWSPSADAILVHASGLRLDVVPVDGEATPSVLERRPGSFQAPVWLDGPVPLVYSAEEDGADSLVVSREGGLGRRALITYEGYLQYAVSAESGLIALHVLDESRAPIPRAITVSAQRGPPPDVVDHVGQNQLVLMAVFGGEPTPLYPREIDNPRQPVRAFYWNPDGSTLAWLVEIDAGEADCSSETQLLQWRFWGDGNLMSGPAFTPTATFACQYLPFFDQFGQTSTYWNPEGTEIAYAGIDPASGQRGIFAVEAGHLQSPRFIVEGEHALWSPSAAGSAASSI